MDDKTYCLNCIHKEVCGWYPREDCNRFEELKQGRWIFWDKNRVMCSECKLEPYSGKGADSFKYCPHCGAKMEA